MEIVSLKEISLSDWIQFVDKSDECWIYHRPEFQDTLDASFQGFGFISSNKLMGVCILYARKTLGTKVLTYHRGPAGLALDASFCDESTYQIIHHHLVSLAKKLGCSAIHLILPICAPMNLEKNYEESHLEKLGFQKGYPWGESTQLIPSYTNLIKLTDAPEMIFRGFSKSPKGKCKIAAKLGLQCKMICEEENPIEWQHFINNHHATFKRSGAVPFQSSMFKFLYQLVTTGLATLFNFYHGEKCIASLFLLTYKNRAFYFASGLQPDYYLHGVSAYIHWESIKQLAAKGYQWYEVGQSFPDLPSNSKLYTIGEFKKMFGGLKIPILAGTLITSKIKYNTGLILPRYAKKVIKPIWRKIFCE